MQNDDDPPSTLPDTVTAVMAANRSFYDAFSALDGARMATVWSRRPSDACIHPGWDLLQGWPDISAAWHTIFENTPFLSIQILDVHVEVRGEGVAWVTCTEHLYMVLEQQTTRSKVAATNIFEHVEGRWCMVLHHGSPVAHEITPTIPGGTTDAADGEDQDIH